MGFSLTPRYMGLSIILWRITGGGMNIVTGAHENGFFPKGLLLFWALSQLTPAGRMRLTGESPLN